MFTLPFASWIKDLHVIENNYKIIHYLCVIFFCISKPVNKFFLEKPNKLSLYERSVECCNYRCKQER
ncbi:hypothetical protein wTkk_000320 [Wolbachia endosymbiont of Trichogramma kaykai]